MDLTFGAWHVHLFPLGVLLVLLPAAAAGWLALRWWRRYVG